MCLAITSSFAVASDSESSIRQTKTLSDPVPPSTYLPARPNRRPQPCHNDTFKLLEAGFELRVGIGQWVHPPFPSFLPQSHRPRAARRVGPRQVRWIWFALRRMRPTQFARVCSMASNEVTDARL